MKPNTGRAFVLCCVGLLALGCNHSQSPTSASVSALLLDSLANLPIDGQFIYWTVGMTTDSVKTSAAGQFTFTVPTGPIRFTYSDPARYEPLDRTITVRRDTSITLKVQRTLPFLRNFSVSASGVLQATIIDLQGAGTIAQDNSTWVVYNYGTSGQSSAIPAGQWTWTSIDGLTWSVSVNTNSSTVTNAYWNVMDNQYPTGFLCVAGQSQCTPDAP